MTRIRALALVLFATSCASEPAEPAGELALWSEFLDDAAVIDALPFVAGEGAALYLAVPAARIGDDSLARVFAEATAAGVEVRAWLLLDEADGYWPNEHNIDAVRAAATAFADWRDAAGLAVDWVIFDMEMSLQRTEAVAAEIEANGTLAGLEMLKAGRDPETFAASRDAYAELVSDLQARGLRVMAVTYPTILDDPADGDDDIADQLDAPIRGIGWDQTSFMVYQSLIYELAGSWYGPGVIKSYADSAAAEFGDTAAVALGIVGTAGVPPVEAPYPDAETLLLDTAAARAAGLPISVYSLDGLLEQSDPGSWIDRGIEPRVPDEGGSEGLRRLIRSLFDG